MTDKHAVNLHMDGDSGEYYVYALSTIPARGKGFNPNDIFYVGKGKGLRWSQHFAEARRAIDSGLELSTKHAAIKTIFAESDDELDYEDHVYIVKGGLDEPAALTLEALTIELLRNSGVPLTNVVSGHHSGALLKPAAEVRKYYSAELLVVEAVSAVTKAEIGRAEIADFVLGGSRESDRLTVVVKGSADSIPLYEDRTRADVAARFGGGVVADIGNRVDDGRRAWDPSDPWTDEEARERAHHYWPVRPAAVEMLMGIAADGRLSLAMLVVDKRAGQSAVRYEWHVDSEAGVWLDYGDRIGFPLGAAIDAHDSWVGRSLVRKHDGKQILEAHASGIGFAAR